MRSSAEPPALTTLGVTDAIRDAGIDMV
ncbi:hypothetical protein BDI4_600081 [Burkholderia diffusa]|nr:hypothetical protein BDI4_600081 [Burkholderia diffusa]